MSETKAKRGPKKSAADKLAELVTSRRKELARLVKNSTALYEAHRLACDAVDVVADELKQLEAAHKALVGAGDAGA